MYGDLYYEELNEDADFFTNHVIAIFIKQVSRQHRIS